MREAKEWAGPTGTDILLSPTESYGKADRKAASAFSQTTENMPREGLGGDAAFRKYKDAAETLIETNPNKQGKKSTLGFVCFIIIQLVIYQ